LKIEAPKWQKPIVRVEKIDATSRMGEASVTFTLESSCIVRVPTDALESMGSIKLKASKILRELNRSDRPKPAQRTDAIEAAAKDSNIVTRFVAAVRRSDQAMNRKLLRVIDFLREPIL
jgi:hypothetical protein